MLALLALLLSIVTNVNTSSSYACDGVQTTYSVGFPYGAVSEITVTSTTALNVVTTLAITTDYTLSLASTQSIATLTLTAGSKCPNLSTLRIARITPLTQPVSLRTQGPYKPETHEAMYDRLTRQLQEVKGSVPNLSAGQLITGNVQGLTVLPAGSSGQVLTSDATQPNGLSWLSGSVGGYTAPVTGAVSRPASGKFSDVLSVKDFAVLGDASDEHVKIQTAITNSNGLTLYFPCGTYGLSTTGLTVAAGATIRITGASRECVNFVYAGTGTALTVGTSSADTTNVVLDNFSINVSTGTGANGIKMVRTTGGAVRDVYLQAATGGTDSGVGLDLDGAGNYVGNITVDRVRINGNWTKGSYNHGPGTNTCNHIDFRQVSIARATAKPGTGTIGFQWASTCGDGAMLIPDVENYDVGFQIDGRFLVGPVRAENNTVGVAFSATSVSNTLWLQGFSNTTAQTGITTGVFNALYDPIGFQSTVNNGGADSQFNLTDTSDHRIDIQFRAGSSAEQQERLRFLKKDGTLAGQIIKTTLNDVTWEDGSANALLRYASGNPGLLAGARNKGTITLAAGTGTATVTTGSVCVCSDTTAVNVVKCAVVTNTLTATGTGTDVVAYNCW